jgi:hypothetical protein
MRRGDAVGMLVPDHSMGEEMRRGDAVGMLVPDHSVGEEMRRGDATRACRGARVAHAAQPTDELGCAGADGVSRPGPENREDLTRRLALDKACGPGSTRPEPQDMTRPAVQAPLALNRRT